MGADFIIPDIYTTDLHTHTTYSDGIASPREMVLAAIDKGFTIYGISDHSYTDFDDCCMGRDALPAYLKELRGLQREFEGRIELRVGIEQDYYSVPSQESFDYIIGSVHYIKMGNDYITIDYKPEMLESGVKNHFNGDFYSICEKYYELVSQVVDRTNATIIGHFDLIKKLNRQNRYFDEDSPRYKRAALEAAERLLSFNIPFEINTGGMYRGYREDPYPAPFIQDFIRERGGSFIYSSDAHDPKSIGFGFDMFKRF